MNRYTVIEEDGTLFGPVGIDELREWVKEGRVTPETIIADSASGTRSAAHTVPGLFTHSVQPSPARPAPQSSRNMGIIANLFEVSFNSFITAKLLSRAYLAILIISALPVLATIGLFVASLGQVASASSQGFGDPLSGMSGLLPMISGMYCIAAIIAYFGWMLIVRIIFEFFIINYKIYENIRELNGKS